MYCFSTKRQHSRHHTVRDANKEFFAGRQNVISADLFTACHPQELLFGTNNKNFYRKKEAAEANALLKKIRFCDWLRNCVTDRGDFKK